MISIAQVFDQLEKLFSDSIDLDEFEDWIALHSWDMHLDSGKEAQELVWAIELGLSEYSSGHIDRLGLMKQFGGIIIKTVQFHGIKEYALTALWFNRMDQISVWPRYSDPSEQDPIVVVESVGKELRLKHELSVGPRKVYSTNTVPSRSRLIG